MRSPPIADEILYAAQLCGVRNNLQRRYGAQAIAALAFGTRVGGQVDKDFGPATPSSPKPSAGSASDLDGAAIDMPAGPSEVLVIARQRRDAGFRRL